MIAPRPESYVPATPADLVCDAIAGILDGVPEIRDFFEVLPQWDDAPRSGAFCAVTCSEGDGVAGEDGGIFAPAVDFTVGLFAAQGGTLDAAGFHAARRAVNALVQGTPALRRALLALVPCGNLYVAASPAESGADGARLVATWRGSVLLASNPFSSH